MGPSNGCEPHDRRSFAILFAALDRKAYQRKPIKRGEFDVWEGEQVWGDE